MTSESRAAFPLAILALAALLAAGGCRRAPAPLAPQVEAVGHGGLPIPPAGAPLVRRPRPATPRAALEAMAACYREADGLDQRTTADIRTTAANHTEAQHQTVVVRYLRRPARAAVLVQDNLQGTTQLWADGRSLVAYSGIRNSYTESPCKGELAALATAIDSRLPQMLSPITFLRGGPVFPGATDLRFDGAAEVQGHECIVVRGRFAEAFVGQMGARGGLSPRFRPRGGSFALWLDGGTMAMWRATVDVRWEALAAGNTARPAPLISTVVAEVTEMVANPRLSEGDFVFTPPPGANPLAGETLEQQP